ncbi:hypothetical protein D9757_011479 [Collybiopsis confluens]|uniref:Uncharacterized protein n=1 Tax=Collybiopsis confluens TaxID=2823264 RepID=A0A8H5GVR3_9AGAR|nr:hypothetical protein D9757_011479 [Collybiopsis confluens]
MALSIWIWNLQQMFSRPPRVEKGAELAKNLGSINKHFQTAQYSGAGSDFLALTKLSAASYANLEHRIYVSIASPTLSPLVVRDLPMGRRQFTGIPPNQSDWRISLSQRVNPSGRRGHSLKPQISTIELSTGGCGDPDVDPDHDIDVDIRRGLDCQPIVLPTYFL